MEKHRNCGRVRGRPKSPRKIDFTPKAFYFKPWGIPLRNLQVEFLSPEELEVLRLKNIQNLHQEQCARKMGISQSTFQRILVSANKKITSALISGKAIRILKEE